MPNDETKCVRKALSEHKQLIGLVAPATRFAIGELFQQKPERNNSGALIHILKSKLGFSKVFDINFGADETTIVDTNELLEHLGK